MLNTVSASVVGLPVAPMNGAISAWTSFPIVSVPLPPSTLNVIGDAFDGDDLPDQSREVGHGSAELAGEQADHRRLLFGGRSIVDEDHGLP